MEVSLVSIDFFGHKWSKKMRFYPQCHSFIHARVPTHLLPHNFSLPFLTHRSQHVVVNGIASFIAAVLSGVPQGSVLGPLLFILFINDMQLCIKHSIIRFFADDTRILKHISCQKHVSELQEDLNSVIQWANQNNMALHEDKFELMVHRHCPQSLLYELPFTADEMSYKVSTGDVFTQKVKSKI